MEPTLPSWIIEICKNLPLAGATLAIWYITLRVFQKMRSDDAVSTGKQMDLIVTQAKSQIETVAKQHADTITILTTQQEQNYAVLNKFAESIEYSGQKITEIKTELKASIDRNSAKIETVGTAVENNRFCPAVRDASGSK